MSIVDKIDSFAADIYFKLPNDINQDFVNICTDLVEHFDSNFHENDKVMKQKNSLLEYLLKVMETNDYIKMADALLYTVRPILAD